MTSALAILPRELSLAPAANEPSSLVGGSLPGFIYYNDVLALIALDTAFFSVAVYTSVLCYLWSLIRKRSNCSFAARIECRR